MANGKPGDHPLSDLLLHGIRAFPSDICDLVLQIVDKDALAFQQEDPIRHETSWQEREVRYGRWFNWEKGEDLEGARAFLARKLALASVIQPVRDPSADLVRDEILERFPEWNVKARQETMTYGLEQDQALSGKRVHFEVFTVQIPAPAVRHTILSVYTYPEPEVYWGNSLIRRYRRGEADLVVGFLVDLTEDRIVILESIRGDDLVGARASDPRLADWWKGQSPSGRVITWNRQL